MENKQMGEKEAGRERREKEQGREAHKKTKTVRKKREKFRSSKS